MKMKNKEKRMKFDKNKLRWDLLPLKIIKGIVQVLTFGANKYAPNNWQKVENPKDRYFAALMRHLEAYQSGEKIDKESKLHHLKHAMTNIVFLLFFDCKEE